MTQNQTDVLSAVITTKDIDALNDRLMGFENALKRNILHERHYDDGLEDVVDNILYDVRYGVIEAWAEKLFPGRYSGVTAAQTGQFDLRSFELFQENDLTDDVLFEDEIDRLVAAQQRKALEAGAPRALNAGELVFCADRNPVTTLLQFRPGRYSTETETLRWYRSLNDEQVRVYGVFAEMVPNTAVNCCVRLIPFHKEDPCTGKSVFLGWAFFKGKEAPTQMSFCSFGKQVCAIFGFVDAKFSEDELNASTYEHSVGQKWSTATA